MVQMLTTQTNKETLQMLTTEFVLLYCEHLQRVRWQIDESSFLNLQAFFLFAARFFFGCVVIFEACAL